MPKTLSGLPHSSTRSAWQLAVLTVAVLLAHWAVLRAAPQALASHENREAAETWAFATRTITAPAAPPSPGPVAVNPRRTAPARATAGVKPLPSVDLFPTGDLEKNATSAPVETEQQATNLIANHSPTGSTSEDVQTQLAAAAPSGLAKDGTADVAASATTKPLPAKAVRNYLFPPTARLKYAITGEVKGFPYYVNGELAWAQDGKTYNARMEISHFLLGSRVQTSTGQLGAQGLEPTRFGDKVKSEVAAHFVRDKGKVIFSANTPDAPLLDGAQDQLSIFMQIAAMLGGDPGGFPTGSTLTFQAVGPRTADAWVFTVGTSETLTLPGGEMQAVHLWRDPSGEYDPKTEVWLAPALGYLPVRIRLSQRNGDFVDQQWKATEN